MRSDSYSRYLRSEMYKDFLNGSRKKVRPRCFFFTEFSLTAVSCRQNCVEKTNKKKKERNVSSCPCVSSFFLPSSVSLFLPFFSFSLSLSLFRSVARFLLAPSSLRLPGAGPWLLCNVGRLSFVFSTSSSSSSSSSFIHLAPLPLPSSSLSAASFWNRRPSKASAPWCPSPKKTESPLLSFVSLSLSLSLSRRFRFESICRPKRPRQKKKQNKKKQPGRLVVLPLFVRILISGLFRSFLFVGFFIYLFFNVLVVIFCFFHPALSWFGSFFFDAGRFHQPKKPELITAKLNKQTHTHTTQSTNAALRKMIRPRNARADRPDLRRSASVQFQHFDVKTSTSRRIEPEEEEEEDGGDFQRIDKRHGRHRNRTRAEIRREIMERPSFL